MQEFDDEVRLATQVRARWWKLPGTDHLDHVWVPDPRGDDRLTLETCDERRVAQQSLVNDLERHVAVDAQLASAVNARHRALPHEFFDSEVFLDDSTDERVVRVLEPCGLRHAA